MNGNQVLGYLARNDKWFLGGGKKVIWAPEFPVWLEQPGFWDHACYLDYKVGPLFTLTILDKNGREIDLQWRERYWQPDHTTNLYRNRRYELNIAERRALLPWDTLVSTFEISNGLEEEQTYQLILWTAQERFESNGVYELENCKVRPEDGTLSWQRRIRERNQLFDPAQPENVMMRFNVALGSNLNATSYGILTSDRQPNYPRWHYSPFYEKLAQYGHLGNPATPTLDPDFGGLIYFGLHYTLTVPGQSRAHFNAFAAIAGSEEAGLVGLQQARRLGTGTREGRQEGDKFVPGEKRATYPAKKEWSDYFESVPNFSCSDPYLEKYYWYRWYGLRLNTIQADDPRIGLPHPCIFEGINLGWFRQHITYSAQCHMLETRWMHDPKLAQGSLLNFISNQQEDGSFPGVIKNIYQGDRSLRIGVAFYHANWGMAVRELHRIHPDDNFLEKIYEPLSRYALYFDKVRDPDHTGLYDVINHWETGMEFMSRYQEIEANADKSATFRLKGLDATVYIYQLLETLAWIGEKLAKPEALRWQTMAEKTRRNMLDYMWDGQNEFFYDVNPANMQRTAAKAAPGFYPFLANSLASREHLGTFTQHLFNENEFWTAFPVPATSRDDATFSAEGEWDGQRLVCPWNGRSWLMTNSHVTEALCRASLEIAPELRPKAVELLNRYIRMLFLDGEVEKPSSYEYYNPITGQAPFFRGTEDYMHSWIVDLIIKYVVGVQPQDNGRVLIRPLPFNLDYFMLDKIRIGGHELKVNWRKNISVKQPGWADQPPVGLTVWVDGQQVGQTGSGSALEILL